MDIIFKLLNFVLLFELIESRGSMLEPPQRSSLWRVRPWKKDKTFPKNLDDYGLNCGGFWRLHGINKGKCGVCGDPYDAESRQNEAGGTFANGIIVRRYRQHRKFINVTIDITSNIGGYFEFRICPHNNLSAVVTQECLDKHPLTIHEHGRKFYPKGDEKFKLALDMPKNITCKQCVLQWKWRGSYNWGRCDDGYQDVGCGNQEEYYNCADIAILPSKRRRKSTPKPEPSTTTTTTAAPTDQWEQVVNENIAKDDKLTIPIQKDVKTMIKDVNDVKSIDSIYRPSTNLIDPFGIGDQVHTGISGIPIYIVPTDSSPFLPSVTLMPTIVPGFNDKVDHVLAKPQTTMPPISVEPIPIPMPTEPSLSGTSKASNQNKIYDLTSEKVMNGVKQDLVQPPGNEISKKVNLIEGSTKQATGVGASKITGSGNAPASASAASTNKAHQPNINAQNTSLTDLLFEETSTLDPPTMQKNSNMLSQMFYGAVASGVDPELENLLPFSLFPFNLLGDPQQQPIFGDTADQFIRTMYALNQQRKLNLTNEQSAMLESKMSTMDAPLLPTVGTGINKQVVATKPETISKVEGQTSQVKTEGQVRTTGQSVTANNNRNVERSTRQGTKSTGQIVDPLSTATKTTTGMLETTATPWSEMLINMNSMLVSLSDHIDTIVQGQNTVAKGQNTRIQGLSTVSKGQNTIQDQNIDTDVQNTIDQDRININEVNQTKKVDTVTGNIPQTTSNMTRLASKLTDKQPDGVVVSNIQISGDSIHKDTRDRVGRVHSIGNGLLTSQVADITSNSINQNLQSLSQMIPNQMVASQSSNADQNTPLIISDPKSQFSFANLGARNVEFVDSPQSNVRIQANMNTVQSSPNNQNFVISDVPDNTVSDVAQSTLNKRFVEISKSNEITQNSVAMKNTQKQNANAILFEKMLGRLNSGIMVSNSKQARSTDFVPVKPVSKDSMKKALETLYRSNAKKTTSNENSKQSKPPINVWNMAKNLNINKNQVLPTEVTPFGNVLFNPLLNNGLLVHPGTPMGTANPPLFNAFDGVTNNILNDLLWNTQTTTASPLGLGLFQGNVIA